MAAPIKPEVAFGKVLKELRGKKGLSQETLAFESGLDRTFISLMERGLRQPSLTTILRLAKALETTSTKIVELVEKQLSGQCK